MLGHLGRGHGHPHPVAAERREQFCQARPVDRLAADDDAFGIAEASESLAETEVLGNTGDANFAREPVAREFRAETDRYLRRDHHQCART